MVRFYSFHSIMATIYSKTNEIHAKWIEYFRVGYQEVPEVMLLPYDISTLTGDTINWGTLKLKDISEKISLNPTGEAIEWYIDDIKEATAAITVRTSDTVFETAANIVAGEELYNRNTGKTYVVTSVTGAAVTIDAADAGSLVGNVIVRTGFAKLYGQDNGLAVTRNDLTNFSNYIQFSEYTIASDMIDLNKTRVFLKDEVEHMKSLVGDAARKAVLSSVFSFYIGKKAKISSGGTYRYTAGGLDQFIPWGMKVNIKGVDATATKANIRTQLEIAYGSGVANIYQENNLVFFCTARMSSELDALYEDAVIYNDKLESIGINIKTINLGGRKLRIVESSILNTIFGSAAVGYLYPLKDTFMYNVPNRRFDKDMKIQKNGWGIMYDKPITNLEATTSALATTHSFVFGTATSGAYQRWTFA